MSLLAPWFLAGLAALAVPVLVHLINRERKTVVPFPSLMFLRRVPYRSIRRQKLRHLLLFAMRCLAIALIVAAFARPFFETGRGRPGVIGNARERVILLDRSYSMGYGDHWRKALDAARAAARELGPQDRATLVAFADEAVALTEPSSDRVQLERAAGRVTLSAEGTRFGPAVKLAGDILAASQFPNKEVVLISDFQRRGWLSGTEVRLSSEITVTPVDVSEPEQPDVAVAAVTTDRAVEEEAGEAVTVVVRLTNTGKSARQVDASLEIGGRRVDSRRITVPASGAAQVRFSPAGVPGTVSRGVVRITRDALAPNDVFYFTIAPDDAVAVLVVEPALPRANQSLYLKRSLEIGNQPRFRVDVKWADSLRPPDFASRALVVLNEVAPPGGELGARLRDAVRAGVGLVFAPGGLPTDRVPPEWHRFLGLTLGVTQDRSSAGGARIARVVYASPVFEDFAAPGSGDFATAHVFRYRAFTVPGDTGVLAWFDDGAPVLVERTAGRGKVLLWASSFDDYWTDFPVQPVFLPFIHELAKHAGRYTDARAWFTAGEVLDLARHGELTAAFQAAMTADTAQRVGLTLETPSGRRLRVMNADTARAVVLVEQGFYELRDPLTAPGSGRPIAVNVDLGESDLAHLDPEEFVSMVTAPTGPGAVAGTAGPASREDLERRQTIWWYLLIAAFLVMAAETLLSNRLSGAAT